MGSPDQPDREEPLALLRAKQRELLDQQAIECERQVVANIEAAVAAGTADPWVAIWLGELRFSTERRADKYVMACEQPMRLLRGATRDAVWQAAVALSRADGRPDAVRMLWVKEGGVMPEALAATWANHYLRKAL